MTSTPDAHPQSTPDESSASLCQLRAKREQILQGAEKVFLACGYEGASMSQIAREAGVSKGTLYNHFDGKASLFSAFFEERSKTKLAPIEAISREEGQDVHTVLRRLAETAIKMMLNPTSMDLYRIIVGEAGKFPNLADVFWRYGFERTLHNLSDWLRRRSDAGELQIEDPDFAAEQLMILCQTRIVHRRRLMLPVDDSPEAISRLASVTADSFMKIYGSRHQ
ncbi:TetR family transcriptional regulator [Gluconobacter thailandicus]|uniref:TetR/AcrR family transcriptional regulator n=1 Tax=Gluconobacter thailandicus TaxID=257438 RepID=UPI000776DA96|nr:TetR/AcrR family transcriptional regulator [Gluconobacter thailandicus]KXV32971.1 TetR family transcriptional regulator [Gluconobacter thailandicus]